MYFFIFTPYVVVQQLNRIQSLVQLATPQLLSNLYYKMHQIPKLNKRFLSHLAVVFVQSIEARC